MLAHDWIGREMEPMGWIKLHRSLLGKGYYKKSTFVHLWVHCLMRANHKTTEIMWNGKTMKLKEGQFITGRNSLAHETGISQSSIQRILKYLEIEHQLEQRTTNTSRLITVVNWKKYQQTEQPVEQRVNSERTASEQRVNTDKKEEKNKNEENDKKRKEPLPEIPDSLKTPEFESAWKDWKKHRQEINKKLTPKAVEKKFKQLEEWGIQRSVAAIERSIREGYQGIFEESTRKAQSNPINKPPSTWELKQRVEALDEQIRIDRKKLDRFSGRDEMRERAPKTLAELDKLKATKADVVKQIATGEK